MVGLDFWLRIKYREHNLQWHSTTHTYCPPPKEAHYYEFIALLTNEAHSGARLKFV